MHIFITILFFLLAFIFLMCIGTTVFMGFGALIAQMLPLSLFQASCLTIGATFAFTVIVYVLTNIMHKEDGNYEPDDYYEYDDEFEDDIFLKSNLPKVGRNIKCPCGSNKKYKNCCGKAASK